MTKNEIEEYLESCYPNEGCAVLIDSSFYPIKNISRTPKNSFVLDYEELSTVLDIGDISIIIHSHCDSNALPSKVDLESMKLWDMGWWIYSIIEGKIDEIWKSI